MQHVNFNELRRQLEDTPVSQIEKLRDYSEEQAKWHQGYKDLLGRVIKHRKGETAAATVL